MENFFNYTRLDLAKFLKESFELPKFRADQLYKWVYARGITDFSLMTDIKKETREIFACTFSFPDLTLETRLISNDGSRKYLFKLKDDSLIESVFIIALISDLEKKIATKQRIFGTTVIQIVYILNIICMWS